MDEEVLLGERWPYCLSIQKCFVIRFRRLDGPVYNFSRQTPEHRQMLVTRATLSHALHSHPSQLDLTASAKPNDHVYAVVAKWHEFLTNQSEGTVLVLLLDLHEWRLHVAPDVHCGFVVFAERNVDSSNVSGKEAMKTFWAPYRFWEQNLSR